MSAAKTLRAADLDQFTGSEHRYRHPLAPHITYTDGAAHVAEAGGAYWLLDAIVSHQCVHSVRNERLQVWRLTVADNRSAMLCCKDGDGYVVAVQKLEYTDFPLPEIELWLQNDVIFLPSEY